MLKVFIVPLILTPIHLITGAYSARRESYLGQAITIIIALANLGFVVLQLVDMYSSKDPVEEADYLPARQRMTAYAAMAIPLSLATIVMTGICMRNFNKGLKAHLRRSRVPDGNEFDLPARHKNGAASGDMQTSKLSSRLEID